MDSVMQDMAKYGIQVISIERAVSPWVCDQCESVSRGGRFCMHCGSARYTKVNAAQEAINTGVKPAPTDEHETVQRAVDPVSADTENKIIEAISNPQPVKEPQGEEKKLLEKAETLRDEQNKHDVDELIEKDGALKSALSADSDEGGDDDYTNYVDDNKNNRYTIPGEYVRAMAKHIRAPKGMNVSDIVRVYTKLYCKPVSGDSLEIKDAEAKKLYEARAKDLSIYNLHQKIEILTNLVTSNRLSSDNRLNNLSTMLGNMQLMNAWTAGAQLGFLSSVYKEPKDLDLAKEREIQELLRHFAFMGERYRAAVNKGKR